MGELHSSIVRLFERLMPIYNPSGYEAALLTSVGDWLTERGISYSSDPRWGLHFTVQPPQNPQNTKNGLLLLLAHLDSDPYHNSEGLETIRYEWLQDGFEWGGGPVGEQSLLLDSNNLFLLA